MEAQIHMSWRGIHDDDLNAAVRGWRHKKVAELEELLKAEYKTPNDQGNLCNPWVKQQIVAPSQKANKMLNKNIIQELVTTGSLILGNGGDIVSARLAIADHAADLLPANGIEKQTAAAAIEELEELEEGSSE